MCRSERFHKSYIGISACNQINLGHVARAAPGPCHSLQDGIEDYDGLVINQDREVQDCVVILKFQRMTRTELVPTCNFPRQSIS